jgi:SPP1 gp7 family putative phage head morphogenesis protein
MPSRREGFRPVPRHTLAYQRELEAWLDKYVPWSTGPGAPLLLAAPEPAEQMLWESADPMARRMVLNVARTNAMAWRSLLVSRGTSAGQSRRIYLSLKNELLSHGLNQRVRELITGNAKLIAAMPDLLANQAAIFVSRQQRRGLRSAAIVPELRKRLPLLRKSTVKMLARTEVARAETALTRARSEGLGLRWYEWATSEDQRVRPSHCKMDGILVALGRCARARSAGRGRERPGSLFSGRCAELPLPGAAAGRSGRGRVAAQSLRARFRRASGAGRVSALRGVAGGGVRRALDRDANLLPGARDVNAGDEFLMLRFVDANDIRDLFLQLGLRFGRLP